jgi:hypothetical protein
MVHVAAKKEAAGKTDEQDAYRQQAGEGCIFHAGTPPCIDSQSKS